MEFRFVSRLVRRLLGECQDEVIEEGPVGEVDGRGQAVDGKSLNLPEDMRKGATPPSGSAPRMITPPPREGSKHMVRLRQK